MPSGDEAKDNKAQIENAISQILDAIQEDRVKIAQLEALAAQFTSGLPGGLPPTAPAAPLAAA